MQCIAWIYYLCAVSKQGKGWGNMVFPGSEVNLKDFDIHGQTSVKFRAGTTENLPKVGFDGLYNDFKHFHMQVR